MACQKFIYKIHSSRLRNAKWKLSLPIAEARRNDEIISIADSQVFRWIDELNGVVDADEKAKEIKRQIRAMKKEKTTPQIKKKIRELYAELDKIQFKPDYMCLIIDKEKDYYRACSGFKINDISYRRLLGTNGGIKNSTIVFVSDRVYDELERRIENGRNKEKPLVTAKLEAYRALACSASVPVSYPKGILVVKDCKTEFPSDIIYISDEQDGEPVMEYQNGVQVQLDESDGYGLMLPSLAKRWSEELGLDYMVSGVNTRLSYEKGVVFTFDFRDFAEKIAGNYIVQDAWGNDIDVRDVELVLTTSMVKLWSSYESCDDYIQNCIDNKYTFGITKTCPKVLESERNLNYQFIQSYNLSDDDIAALIEPTMTEIKEVLNGDWRKTVLFLKGTELSSEDASRLEDDIAKAIMIDPRMANDPYIQSTVYQLIKNRINEAKVGVLKVHGNYSIICGDPYALCQSMFGLPVTGLLKAGEIYNRYWCDTNADELVCFRAPMTCHENIRAVNISRSDEAMYWYQYMNTCTLFNCWDTAAHALNGADKDGDIVMLTDNKVLVSRHIPSPTIMCAQRRAEERISTEVDFIQANISSFGNEIGQTTNWITSMFEAQSRYEPGSKEYDVLAYRIKCGQLYQQNAIDKAKGIECKPMPQYWHDKRSTHLIEDEAERELCLRIAAEKKPYFMRYIYPQLSKQYNTYINNTNKNALRRFQMSIVELQAVPDSELTEEQAEFLKYYRSKMPVGTGSCVMNRICKAFEEEFDGYIGKHSVKEGFNYGIMRCNAEYTTYQYNQIKRLYEDFNRRIRSYSVFSEYEKIDSTSAAAEMSTMCDEFRRECEEICPDSHAMSNIILDMCYTKSSTKKFAWKMISEEIIRNLLDNAGHTVSIPVKDDYGDFIYCGEKFSVVTKKMEVDEY